MAFFEILFPLLLVAGAVSLTVLGTKAFLKGKEKRIAKRQAKRELKLSKRQEKQLQKQAKKQNSLERKGVLKNKENAPKYKMARGVNCIHTVDNYNLIYKGRKGRKYLKLKAKQAFYNEVLDMVNLKERNKTQTKKKINKINKKLVAITKTPLFKQEVQPDYVSTIVLEDGKVFQDKKTYIQCFDENLARQFKDTVESEMAGDISKPKVAQISFNPKSNLSPLMLSATNEVVYAKGLNLINQKMIETIENLDEFERQNAFPITLKQSDSENRNKILIKNENELNKFFGQDSIMEDVEAQTK